MINESTGLASRVGFPPRVQPADRIRRRRPETASRRQPGWLILSLDTELAWGWYDDDASRPRLFSDDGSRERRSILRVLETCDAFGIRATWALVGHLLFSRCEDCEPCPVRAWRSDHGAFRAVHGGAHPLWYAPDVLERLLAARDRHEIAFHGFSHRPFHQMSLNDARAEIHAWTRLAERFDIAPGSIVFPRNRIDHLPAFAEAGFRCFRAPDCTPRWHLRRFGSAFKSADDLLSLSTPRTYGLDALRIQQGLLRIPSGAHLFDFPRRLEGVLDGAGLHRLRLSGIRRAIRRAADEGSLVHLWAHPWEVRTESDVDKLRDVLSVAAEEIAAGRLRSVTMAEFAALAAEARTTETTGVRPATLANGGRDHA